jgi:hypothetical protein
MVHSHHINVCIAMDGIYIVTRKRMKKSWTTDTKIIGYKITRESNSRFLDSNCILLSGKSIKESSTTNDFESYYLLWKQYFKENPFEMEYLLNHTLGYDVFITDTKDEINSANAISVILNERYGYEETKIEKKEKIIKKFFSFI